MTTMFPTLDADLGPAQGEEAPATKKRICIATSELPDRTITGGHHVAGWHLTRLLAAKGHVVVVACVTGDGAEKERGAEIRADYARLGVTIEVVVPTDTGRTPMRHIAAPTWALLDWLRGRRKSFDILHVADRGGLGYGPLLAKSLGIAFGTMHIVVSGTAPTLWTIEGNLQLVSTEEDLGRVFIEQRSVELADTFICGSEHLLEWMREAHYALPARSFVWPAALSAPNPVLDVPDALARPDRALRRGG